MNRFLMAVCSLIIAAAAGGCSINQQEAISVLVVTGGHSFDSEPFARMFDQMPRIQWKPFQLNDDSEVFDDLSDWDYDVIVLYNMTQRISAERQANFLTLLDRGVGVVALHHSLINFQDWPEYKKIIGARYYLKETQEAGTTWPAGTYKHDVQIPVSIADRSHPVTAGLGDFTILDETYKGYSLEPDNHILLTTSELSSQTQIAWTRLYRQSRICTIQLGHGADAYNNPSYRKLLTQAIQWAARSPDE